MQHSIDGTSSLLVIACVGSFLYPLIARMFPCWGRSLSFVICGLHSSALALLIYLRIVDDFSFEHVYQNSHTLQPLLYKITGVWGNYEGSYLFFTWLLSVYAAAMELILRDHRLLKIAASAQHLILAVFSTFCTVFANPFLRILPLDGDGLGFNPLLQDIGLSIHPPILFSGYTGFAPVLSITTAALVLDMDPAEWAKLIRGWVLSAWALLTLGILLGGWWAYRILGWGGFWAWDPVENVVLLPWLIGTALIHMLPIVRKSRMYCNFTFFLAFSTFLCSLYSTFLVRSGFLVSVHTFANDPTRGMYLMLLINALVLIFYALFIVFCRRRKEYCDFSYVSKITALIVHVILLLASFFVIFVGTAYPILFELLTGDAVSVGAPYYSSILSIFLVLLLCILILLPCLSWDGNKPFHLSFKISSVLAAIGLPFSVFFGVSGVLIFLAIFLFFSIFEDFFQKLPYPLTKATICVVFRPGRCAMLLAHLGVAVLTIGVVYSSLNQFERHKYMRVGDDIRVRGFQATLTDIKIVKQKYYEALVGKFTITSVEDNKFIGTLFPENRYYHVEATRNMVSGIHHGFLADLYIIIGDVDINRGISVQFRYKPLILLVWFGGLLIVIGGVLGVINAVLKMRQNLGQHCESVV